MKMAGMAQVLSHRDPSHARDSLLRLNKLRREGILCDLTILVQGQKFKVTWICADVCLRLLSWKSRSAPISTCYHLFLRLGSQNGNGRVQWLFPSNNLRGQKLPIRVGHQWPQWWAHYNWTEVRHSQRIYAASGIRLFVWFTRQLLRCHRRPVCGQLYADVQRKYCAGHFCYHAKAKLLHRVGLCQIGSFGM